jgi:hypothetical protein
MARTIVPVADLRRSPEELLPRTFDHHPLRDSQLLFNEEALVLEKQGEWMRVAAIEQLRFTHEKGWHPYEGWLHRSEIGEGSSFPRYVLHSPSDFYAYGTYFETPMPGTRPIPSALNRPQLLQEAKQFLGKPYLWGGRGSNVDCSGLINLLYRAQGIPIPRDAHDQFLFGRGVSTLLPGDPLYLAKEDRISHVILKFEGDMFIESPETGKKVRLLKEGEDILQEGGRWHFRDRPHPYRGFPISFEIRGC